MSLGRQRPSRPGLIDRLWHRMTWALFLLILLALALGRPPWAQ